MSSEKTPVGAGESSPSMQLLAGSVPILDEALNYFYPERACDPPAALAARMALFTLRDRIRDYVKANSVICDSASNQTGAFVRDEQRFLNATDYGSGGRSGNRECDGENFRVNPNDPMQTIEIDGPQGVYER